MQSHTSTTRNAAPTTASLSNRQQQLRRATPPRSSRLHVVSFLPGSQSNSTNSNNTSNKVVVNNSRAQAPPPQLIKEEKESLQAALKSAGLSDAANVADISPSGLAALVNICKSGVAKKEQDLQKLEGAMLLAEQLFHANGGRNAAGGGGAQPQAVDVWQPIFASAGGFPRLLYIPVPEFFDMHRALPDATAISIIDSLSESIDITSSPERAAAAAGADSGRINIITELGPLTTHFLGTCCWLDDVTFEYSINTVRLDLAGRSFSFNLGGPLKLENELRFFLVTPEVACARSKLGGTMLLAPGPSAGKAYFNSW